MMFKYLHSFSVFIIVFIWLFLAWAYFNFLDKAVPWQYFLVKMYKPKTQQLLSSFRSRDSININTLENDQQFIFFLTER